MRDGLSGTQVVHLGNLTLSGTTPAASAWVDTRGFDEVTLIAVSNTVTDAGTAAGITMTAQHGDSTAASGAAAISADDSVDGETTLAVLLDTEDDLAVGGLGYVGGKRYLRINAVGTTLTDADISILAVCRRAHREPTTLVGTKVAAT